MHCTLRALAISVEPVVVLLPTKSQKNSKVKVPKRAAFLMILSNTVNAQRTTRIGLRKSGDQMKQRTEINVIAITTKFRTAPDIFFICKTTELELGIKRYWMVIEEGNGHGQSGGKLSPHACSCRSDCIEKSLVGSERKRSESPANVARVSRDEGARRNHAM